MSGEMFIYWWHIPFKIWWCSVAKLLSYRMVCKIAVSRHLQVTMVVGCNCNPYLSIDLYLSIYLFIHLFDIKSTKSIYSICLSVCLSIYLILSVCLSNLSNPSYLCVYPYVHFYYIHFSLLASGHFLHSAVPWHRRHGLGHRGRSAQWGWPWQSHPRVGG